MWLLSSSSLKEQKTASVSRRKKKLIEATLHDSIATILVNEQFLSLLLSVKFVVVITTQNVEQRASLRGPKMTSLKLVVLSALVVAGNGFLLGQDGHDQRPHGHMLGGDGDPTVTRSTTPRSHTRWGWPRSKTSPLTWS